MSQLVHDSLWETYVDIGMIYARRGLYSRLERMLESALKDCEDFAEMDPRLIGLVHTLAGRYRAQGDPLGARRLYKRFIDVQKKLLGPNHVDVANSLEQVALFLLTEEAGLLRKKPEVLPALQLRSA